MDFDTGHQPKFNQPKLPCKKKVLGSFRISKKKSLELDVRIKCGTIVLMKNKPYQPNTLAYTIKLTRNKFSTKKG